MYQDPIGLKQKRASARDYPKVLPPQYRDSVVLALLSLAWH